MDPVNYPDHAVRSGYLPLTLEDANDSSEPNNI